MNRPVDRRRWPPGVRREQADSTRRSLRARPGPFVASQILDADFVAFDSSTTACYRGKTAHHQHAEEDPTLSELHLHLQTTSKQSYDRQSVR